MPGYSKFKDEKFINQSTEGSIFPFLPGDFVMINGKRGLIVGTYDKKLMFQEKINLPISQIDNISLIELIYRVDICSVLNNPTDLMKTSFLFPLLKIIPGDIVEFDEIGKCTFLGYGIIFLSFINEKKEYTFFRYSVGMLDLFFTIRERPSFLQDFLGNN